MILADFCMSPTENLLMLTPDSVYNVTSYYTTCSGTNPFADDLNQAESLVDNGEIAINAVLQTSCPNDQYLEQALQEINHINVVFGKINELIGCQVNQEEAQRVLNDGVCHGVFQGLYFIWVGMFVCGGMLVLATLAAACTQVHHKAVAEVAASSYNNGAVEGGSTHSNAAAASAGGSYRGDREEIDDGSSHSLSPTAAVDRNRAFFLNDGAEEGYGTQGGGRAVMASVVPSAPQEPNDSPLHLPKAAAVSR
jgi:hypothetical protein